MKSVTSIILILTIIITTLIVPFNTVFAAENSNIISNGGFEQGKDSGWLYGNKNDIELCADDCHSGQNSLRLAAYRSNVSKGYVYQKITVEPYRDYTLSFYAKGVTSAICQVVSNFGFDYENMTLGSKPANSYIASTEIFGNTGNSWENIVLNFNSEKYSEIYLQFDAISGEPWYQVKDGNRVLIDDVSLKCLNIEEVNPPYISKLCCGNSSNNSNGPYITSDDKNLILDNGFESGDLSEGNWNTDSFIGDGISVTNEPDAVRFGEYGLKFFASQEKVSGYFAVEVESETEYCFSVWVKMPYYSENNIGKITFGITNLKTRKFILPKEIPTTGTAFCEDYQLGPQSPDNNWYLMSVCFNSGSHKFIGITISGECTTAYFDNMYLMKSADKISYLKDNTENKSEYKKAEKVGNAEIYDCDTSVNLFQNADFEAEDDTFWNSGLSYEKNVKIFNTREISHQNVLKYENNEIHPDRTYYIKWITVKPNTIYTFSAEYVVKDTGKDSFFGLIGSSANHIKYPNRIATFGIDEANKCNGLWQRINCQINTNDAQSIGFVVFNAGGEAYIDSVRFFETYGSGGEQNGSNVKSENNVLNNSGFENGTAGWNFKDNNENLIMQNNTDYPAYNGNSCLRLASYRSNGGCNGYVYQQLNVEPNKDYLVKLYAKSNRRAVCQIVTETGFDYGGNDIENAPVNSYIATSNLFGWSNGEWNEVTFKFNSGDNKKLYIQFDFISADYWNDKLRASFKPDDFMLIDDISVVKLNKGLTCNGGFEANSEGWSRGNIYDSQVVTNDSIYPAHSGNSALRLAPYRSINGSKAYVYQKISVKPNTDYFVKFYARGNKLATCQIVSTLGFEYISGKINTAPVNSFIASVQNGTFGKTNSQWKEISFKFNSGNNSELYIQFDSLSEDPWNISNWQSFAPADIMLIDDVNIALLGDSNDDCIITLMDLIRLKRYLAERVNNIFFEGADVDTNGKLDVYDLVLIRKKLLN